MPGELCSTRAKVAAADEGGPAAAGCAVTEREG